MLEVEIILLKISVELLLIGIMVRLLLFLFRYCMVNL